MTIAAYVNDSTDVNTLVPWTCKIAKAMGTNVLIVIPKRSKGKESWNEITPESYSEESPIHTSIIQMFQELDDDQYYVGSINKTIETEHDPDKVCVEAKELLAPDPNATLVSKIEELDLTVLLIDSDEPIRQTKEGQQEPLDVFFDSPCETLVMRGKMPDGALNDGPLNVLVVAEKEAYDAEVALKRAHNLTWQNEGKVTFLYVCPDDDDVADQVGLISANRIVNRVPSLKHDIECRVALEDKMSLGIMAQKDLESFDLVLVAARNSSSGYKFVRVWETEERTSKIPLGVIKGAVPLATKIWSRCTAKVRAFVPQMDRELRVKLVERLHSNSRWDFDFIALISLSTLIAALGLVRNSGAVVIGAMLVAPLMTPLVGIGFALVQGNVRLIRQSLRSLAFGFALAFFIGLIVGILVQLGQFKDLNQIPNEMLARGNPNLLDLIVALVSGIAGAYAMGRPNLISALPGVAIAAALVPPIATSGLALSLFEFRLSSGSLLLFLTNIVAIVLGCAIVFWAIGIDSRVAQKTKSGDDRKARQWPRLAFSFFVVLSIILAAAMHYTDPVFDRSQKDAEGRSVQQAEPE